jgi:Predicted membrane protein (DUF2157)
MDPDLVDAIESLHRERVLTDTQAAPLLRAARGDLISVERELRTALYLGVLLVTSGIGLFLKENHERLGPAAIAGLIGVGALGCLAYAWRRLPGFTWESAGTGMLGADYVLLLGVLLVGADLGYLESQWRVLGPEWPYHLLLLSGIALALAYRFDSRAVLSLALTSFAAWRGVAVSLSLAGLGRPTVPAVRANALGCAALFLAAGFASVRARRKAHFEPVYVTLGLLLLFGGLLSGVFQYGASNWLLWEAPLVAAAALVIVVAYRRRRALDFSIGVLAAYFGILRILFDALSGAGGFFVVAASALAVIALLVRAQRRMKETR